uniref:DNA mismatch repair proteins mutS family domain-containing protein n=1 Tax=viral metagenome TaxID=1070528 RepID=A0A6C0CA50_9ZZZZ
MAFVTTCLKHQKNYTKIYGDKTIVFIQKGTFYEAYSTTTEGFDLEKISEILKTELTRADKNTDKPPDIKNPNMLGFPVVKAAKNLKYLTQEGYIVVLFDEVRGEKERVLSGIYSIGTFISDSANNNANYVISAYIVEEAQLKTTDTLLAIGLTILDNVTGKNSVHEFYSKPNDQKFGLDELSRIFKIFKPTECIVYYQPITIDKNKIASIKSYLELDSIPKYEFCIYHDNKDTSKLSLLSEKMFKVNYQNTYFSKIYHMNLQMNLSNKKSPIEILNLERYSYVIISLIIMLRFLSKRNINLLTNISAPNIYIYDEHLILGNDAVGQLNVIDSNNLESYNKKIESLYDVVNKTSTPMGKRLLKSNLTNPYSQKNKKKINEKYTMINELLKKKFYEKVADELKNINDMERMHRKMANGTISPGEFYRLNKYYNSVVKIAELVSTKPTIASLISDETVEKFNKYRKKYSKDYILDDFPKYGNNHYIDAKKSFFAPGVYAEIDGIQSKIKCGAVLVDKIASIFTDWVNSQRKPSAFTKKIVSIKKAEDKSSYFTVTRINGEIIKRHINKKKLKIEVDGETIVINASDVEYKYLKTTTKISISTIVDHTRGLQTQYDRMTEILKATFRDSVMDYYVKNESTLRDVTNFIAELDFVVSGAAVADKYYYCRPTIVDLENPQPSYIDAQQLRHPIIERLCEETEYIPNDIELGARDNKNGMLIYAINFAGKSSTMKSVGLAVILAQIGYYVPAKSFTYEPYMAIYARINANDNMLKGLSSFVLEMTEIDSILKRVQNNGENTLVIGDEVCRGTEITSAISLVSSTLITLSKSNATFIFSSHLHELKEIEEVKALTNLRLFHLKVDMDTKNNRLVFERKLTPGTGPSIYGVMVAKYMINNPEFINTAEIIKNRLLNIETFDFPTKQSKWNAKLIVTKCALCSYKPTQINHKELETHHINFQKNCCKDNKIIEKPHLTKNGLYNLVILCRPCHEKVHKGQIIIDSYKCTTDGPKLVYTSNENVKNDIVC